MEFSLCGAFYDHIISWSVPINNILAVFHSAVKMLGCVKLSRTLESSCGSMAASHMIDAFQDMPVLRSAFM